MVSAKGILYKPFSLHDLIHYASSHTVRGPAEIAYLLHGISHADLILMVVLLILLISEFAMLVAHFVEE